jgi:hypothetical protein
MIPNNPGRNCGQLFRSFERGLNLAHSRQSVKVLFREESVDNSLAEIILSVDSNSAEGNAAFQTLRARKRFRANYLGGRVSCILS